MSQTQEQQCFTICEMAADWYDLMVLQHITQPSAARANGQLDLQMPFCCPIKCIKTMKHTIHKIFC